VAISFTARVCPSFTASPAKADKADKPEHKEVRKEYVVQRGDTLFSIARKFNIDHDDLKKWNPTHALARLQPGFKLTLWTSSLR
jgi:membrane-bound lytic murein transglycosylase D